MNSADSDSNDGHLGPRSDVNGDASMGQQLAQKWCSDCHAVGAEDAEAYVPSFVLIAEMCFSIGGLNWRRLA
jgi:cytochrome c2